MNTSTVLSVPFGPLLAWLRVVRPHAWAVLNNRQVTSAVVIHSGNRVKIDFSPMQWSPNMDDGGEFDRQLDGNTLCIVVEAAEFPFLSNPTVACLNAAFAADPNAIHSLIVNRVPCNQALADDPYVVVDSPRVLSLTDAPQTLQQREYWQVGALGLVNAVLAANGLPNVAVKFQEVPGQDHQQVVGFCEYNPPQHNGQVEDCHKYCLVPWTDADNNLRADLIHKQQGGGGLNDLEDRMLALLQEKAKLYADQVAPIPPLPPELAALVPQEPWTPPPGATMIELAAPNTPALAALLMQMLVRGMYSTFRLGDKTMTIVGCQGDMLQLRDEGGNPFCVHVNQLAEDKVQLYQLPGTPCATPASAVKTLHDQGEQLKTQGDLIAALTQEVRSLRNHQIVVIENKGRAAFQSGIPIDQNPYTGGYRNQNGPGGNLQRQRSQAWVRGWQLAEQEVKEAACPRPPN